MDRFDENCIRNVKEMKSLIEKALTNELDHYRKDLLVIKEQMKRNGIPVKISFWDRVKDPSVIITALISGIVAVVVALVTTKAAG